MKTVIFESESLSRFRTSNPIILNALEKSCMNGTLMMIHLRYIVYMCGTTGDALFCNTIVTSHKSDAFNEQLNGRNK